MFSKELSEEEDSRKELLYYIDFLGEKIPYQSKVGQINQFYFVKIRGKQNISEFTHQKMFVTILQNKICTLLL